MCALEGALAGDEAIVLTWLPSEGRGLARAVLAAKGDLLFASESLKESTPVHVRPMVMYGRRYARPSGESLPRCTGEKT